MGSSKFIAGGSPLINQHPLQGEEEIFLVTLFYRNQDKLWPGGPIGSYAYAVVVTSHLLN